jgi:hypothetical protein
MVGASHGLFGSAEGPSAIFHKSTARRTAPIERGSTNYPHPVLNPQLAHV